MRQFRLSFDKTGVLCPQALNSLAISLSEPWFGPIPTQDKVRPMGVLFREKRENWRTIAKGLWDKAKAILFNVGIGTF